MSDFAPQYVDIHGYLQWNAIAYKAENVLNITTDEGEQIFSFDEAKHHRCTSNDRKQYFYEQFYPLAARYMELALPTMQCFDDLESLDLFGVY